jgi:enoyl-CoA hydratase/carnithine racemase
VVAVLHGAVVGGGLEIAAACHIRVAETSAYYACRKAAAASLSAAAARCACRASSAPRA